MSGRLGHCSRDLPQEVSVAPRPCEAGRIIQRYVGQVKQKKYYFVLTYCISCRTSCIVMLLFMQGWWPEALAEGNVTTSPQPVAGGGGLGHRPCVKSIKQCSPLIFAFHSCLSFGMYIDYVNCNLKYFVVWNMLNI